MEFLKREAYYLELLLLTSLQISIFRLTRSEAGAGPRKLVVADQHSITFSPIGQTLELVCPIEMSDTSPTFVEWFRENKSLYNERGYQITRKGTLRIKSVSREQAGTYACEGVNGYGAVRLNITLIVDHPESELENSTLLSTNTRNRLRMTAPSIRQQPSASVVDEVGGEATFHCVATGHPTPHVFWVKEGHLLKGSETSTSKGKTHSTLRLRHLTTTHTGTYRCIARNRMGEDTVDYTLQVTDVQAPRILSLEPQSLVILEGEAAVFWCEVSSKPGVKLHIKWLKKVSGNEASSDSIPLFRSGRNSYRPLNVSEWVASGDISKSKLLLRNSKYGDSGTYVCLALNDKGFHFKDVTLTVLQTASKSAPQPFYLASTGITYILLAPFLSLAVLGVGVYFYCKSRRTQTDRAP